MINRLKVAASSVVVPLGLLHMGADRHRALLFKTLAGDLGLPCRVVKGRRLKGGGAAAGTRALRGRRRRPGPRQAGLPAGPPPSC
jgi:hypothetical protein